VEFLQGLEALLEKLCAVVIDNNDGDQRRGARGLGNRFGGHVPAIIYTKLIKKTIGS
jgi:hypothetical protein